MSVLFAGSQGQVPDPTDPLSISLLVNQQKYFLLAD